MRKSAEARHSPDRNHYLKVKVDLQGLKEEKRKFYPTSKCLTPYRRHFTLNAVSPFQLQLSYCQRRFTATLLGSVAYPSVLRRLGLCRLSICLTAKASLGQDCVIYTQVA